MKIHNTFLQFYAFFLFFGSFSLTAQVSYTAHDFIKPYQGGFHYGVNMGGYGTSSNVSLDNGLLLPWTDDELAELCIGNPAAGIPGTGANSIRLALPDKFVEQQGFDIRLEVFNKYNQLGLKDHTVFLNGPSDAHRDFTEYCPGKPSQIFKNLHLPIWDGGANGTPYNDNNYYARYVYEVVSRYGKWVKYWEVWNEPDFTTTSNNTTDPGTPGSWWTEDPSPCDLGGAFGIQAPISHYVRMLRITYEIVKTLTPDSYVALGGIGYPSFLDAILRNTDNPHNGDVSGDYPLKGGAYFDVVSWHYYPHVDEAFKEWNNDRQDFDYYRYSDAAYDEFIERKKVFDGVLNARGYNGNQHPRKLHINTETNLPRKEILSANSAGGNQLQANYTLKAMFAAQAVGLDHLHMYHIGEKRDIGNVWTEQHQFDMMGLYENLLTQNKNTAKHTPQGIALKTMSDALKDYWYDAGKTAQLQLPNNVRGGAFTNANQETTYMLWAKTFRDRSEEASATYTFPNSIPWTNNSSATLTKKEWNYFSTNLNTTISFKNVKLTGNPIFLSLNNTVSPCDGLTVVVNSEGPNCFGYTNGSISVNASNGVQPYTFKWEDNSGSPLRNNLVAGTYYVTVTDGNNCQVNKNIQLNSPPAMNATIQVQNESVAGLKDGRLTAFASGGNPGGYNYYWSNNFTGQANAGLAAGTYSLTVNDTKGCPVIKQAVIEADDIGCGTFKMNAWKTDLTCFNSNNGTISANPTGGTGNISFKWNTGEITGFISNLPSGTYRVTATDEVGCTTTVTTVINSPEQLTLTISANQPTIAGTNNGRASAFVNKGTPPYTHEWSNQQTSPTIQNLQPGVYSLTVTDANGCQVIKQTEIISPEPDCENFEISMVSSNPRCPGTATGYVSANPVNGVGPFKYKWSTGAQTQTIGNLPSGTYFVTITDAVNCSTQSAQTLSPKAPISVINEVQPSTGINNADGIVSLQINGGTSPYRASWDNGDTGLYVVDLAAGAYSVTVYDSNDCVKITQVIVETSGDDCDNFSDLLWQSENIHCANDNDGAIILIPQGGEAPFTYKWSNGANTQGISNLFAGNYTVTATDANGCLHIRTINITQPSALIGSINAQFTGSCGDIANLRAIGSGGTPPYTYDWNTGSQNTNLQGVSAGYYQVTIKDANDCTFTEEFEFEEDNSYPGIGEEVGDITCNGDSDGYIDIEVYSGEAPYTYNWSNGSKSQDIGSLLPGSYDLTVEDANGCNSEHIFIVSEPNPMEVEFNVISPASENEKGSIKANVFGGTGPYTYLWNFGATTAAINNVDVGTYSVTIRDAKGCVFFDEVTLGVISSNQNLIRNNAIKIYPNPSKDHFFIELPSAEVSARQISLLDITGKIISVDQYTSQANLLRMNADNLPSGTYFVRIELEDGYTLGKRIILLRN